MGRRCELANRKKILARIQPGGDPHKTKLLKIQLLQRCVACRQEELYIIIYFSIVCYTKPMPMSIKNLRVEKLARAVAAKTGESLTGAIENALDERLQRLQHEQRSGRLIRQLEEILHRVDRLPVLDSRSADEIVGYDEHGIPR